jgi:hypothetical protein
MTDTTTPNYFDGLQALLDDPLRAARAAAAAGSTVIGYIGDQTPVPLIFAANATPVRLHSGPAIATARADEFLESAHMPELRAICQRWLDGDLDFLRAVVFPRTDDSAQRLYYYLCELKRRGLCGGPMPLLHDVANISRETSVAHTRESTRRLALELGVDEARVASAAARVLRRQSLVAQVQAKRLLADPLPGSSAWRVNRASACDWSDEFDGATHRWLDRAPSLPNPRRVLLVGDALPEDSLHRAIERAGGSVVLELTESDADAASGAAVTLESLSDELHSRRSPVLAMRDDADWVLQRARHARADAVVFWLIEEDEALPWEIARQQRSLQAASIPALLLSRQRWRPDEAALEAVTKFVGGVEVGR